MVYLGCAMAQVVSRRPLTAQAWASPRGICGGQSGTGTKTFTIGSLCCVSRALFPHSGTLVPALAIFQRIFRVSFSDKCSQHFAVF
jgi:hypothetical protein